MEKRKLFIAMSLVLAVAAASLGLDQRASAADRGGQETQQTQVKKKGATNTQKKGKLSKRNQAKVDQAEQFRLRHQKIQSEQGK